MRATGTLAVVAIVASLGGGMLGSSEPHRAEAAPAGDGATGGGGEYRGELYPDPETGCFEVPDGPQATPRARPARDASDAAADVGRPVDGDRSPEGVQPRGPEVERWPGQGFGLEARPWPRCDDPPTSLIGTPADTAGDLPDTAPR